MLGKKLEMTRVVVALFGLIVSLYLATYSTLNLPLSCPNAGILDCSRILGSVYSTTFGVPNPIFGIAFFVAVLALVYLKKPVLLALLNSTGIGFVAYFVYAEYVLGGICVYCTAIHIATVALFAISMLEVSEPPSHRASA